MTELKKGVDICATKDCDDPVGVKYLGLCNACAAWLHVWSQRTAGEVKRRVYQINRLARRAATMPLPGLNHGKLVEFRKAAPRRKAS